MKKMKILFVQYNNRGGASRALEELVINLVKMGVKVTVIMQKFNPFYSENNIENYTIPFRNNLTGRQRNIEEMLFSLRERLLYKYALYLLEKKIDVEDYDLVYSNESRFRFGAQIADKYNKPHVWHIREFGEKGFYVHPTQKNYYRSYMANKADIFIMISNAVSDYWISKGIPKIKCCTIYDGVKVEQININSKAGRSKDLHVIFNASPAKMKGHSVYLKALSLLSPDIQKNIITDFYGNFETNPAYINELKKMSRHLNLKNVNFLGYCNDILNRLCNYDVGMMCSFSEGFGLATAEYMAAGLCVIASNAGANPEIIKDSVNGFLFESGNSIDLSEKIQFVYQNRQVIKNMGIRAIKDCNEKYTAFVNAEKIYKLLNDTICLSKNER